MKRVRIHHEGGQSGPRVAGAMADWRRALLDLERSRVRAGERTELIGMGLTD